MTILIALDFLKKRLRDKIMMGLDITHIFEIQWDCHSDRKCDKFQ